MEQPWNEFLDIYEEKGGIENHAEAVIDALVGLMIRLDEDGWSDYGKRSLRLKEATDEWSEEGGDDREELRDRLEESWSSHEP